MVGGGIWFFSTLTPKPEEPIIPEEAESPEQVIIDETADWKIYRSEEFGLEMKYLIGLNINEVIKGSEICFTGFSVESPEGITCDFCFYLYPSEGKKPCVENTKTGISIGGDPS